MKGTTKTRGTTKTEAPKRGAVADLPADGWFDLPILYEDEGQEDMGDSDIHTRTADILFYGLQFHLGGQGPERVFTDLNLHYQPRRPKAYVSPDVMIVTPTRALPNDVSSYRVGTDGPAPSLVIEVLSERTHQQKDLTQKPRIYSRLGCREYILVDVTGKFLPERLLLKRRRPDGSWVDEQDADGGITSSFGFRVVIDPDGQVRVLNAQTGTPYARPEEAQTAVEKLAKAERAARKAEERIRALEEELARLRQKKRKRKGS
ncbi:MAG TPA: Uma2 family endonuclease [Gemmataceae bacterium]|nr:Uma2 family endonuclease [Gemmataceae bacterium]